MDSSKTLDAIIVGGRPAGLTAALTLARQLHTAVVLDSRSYRNEATQHMHTVLTWDHKDAKDFLAAWRSNILQGYKTIDFADVEVKTVRKNGTGLFEANDGGSRTWLGKKLILATGVVDVYPDINGYAECWAKGMYGFHCLFCHGYEERDSPHSGVLAVGNLAKVLPAMHLARNALQPTPRKVTIYTNGSQQLGSDLTSALGTCSKIVVDTRVITRLEKGATKAEIIIHFQDGSQETEGFLGHKAECKLKGPFTQQLGLEMTAMDDIKTNPPFLQTSVRGVFAAGDDSSPLKVANNALFTGAAAAAGVSAQLQADNLGHQGIV